MEYMPQGSLYDVIQNKALQSSLGYKRRLGFAMDGVKGMEYLHRQNPPIIHRDLKSLNLMVDENWNVKVGDFGFAGVSKSKDKSLAASPWTAPELMYGGEIFTTASDVYAMGELSFHL